MIRTCFLIVCLCMGALHASAHLNENDKSQLLKQVEALARKYHIPDYTILVTQNGTPVLDADRHPTPAIKNYLIGSCSKSFTALAVLHLADKGLLNLDHPVKHYLPWFALTDTAQSNTITIRHLLNQTSGIPQRYGYFDYLTSDITNFELRLAEWCSSITPAHPPGRAFTYCNLNYQLLGLIVHKVTGDTYAQYVNQNIFQPLAMQSSFAGTAPPAALSPITPYQYAFATIPVRSRTYRHSDFIVPQGLINSTAPDMSRYLNCIMNETATPAGDTLLSATAYNTLLTPLYSNYAMGWAKNTLGGKIYMNHLGLNENYSTAMGFCKTEQLCIVVLTNINSFEFCNEAQQTLFAAFAGHTYTPARFSPELLKRYCVSGSLVFVLLGFFYNARRWRKYGYGICWHRSPTAWGRLLPGLAAALAFPVLIPVLNNLSLAQVIAFQPDFGYAAIAIGVLGVLSALLRYWGTGRRNQQSVL